MPDFQTIGKVKWHGIWQSEQHFLMADKYSSSKEKRRIFLYFCDFCKGIGPCLAGKLVVPYLDIMSPKGHGLSEEPLEIALFLLSCRGTSGANFHHHLVLHRRCPPGRQ